MDDNLVSNYVLTCITAFNVLSMSAKFYLQYDPGILVVRINNIFSKTELCSV